MAISPPPGFVLDADTSVPTPLIPRTPAPQTPAQSAKDTADARTAAAQADITEHKASEEAGVDQKQKAAQLSAIESADQLIGAVHRARSLVSGWSTGVGGAILDHIPATQAAQLDTIVNQEIRGNIFLNRVNALKEENPSPTGGTGIGRIMQAEIPLITGSIGALDPVKMGRKGTLDSLDQIEARTLRTKAIINGENPDDPAVQKKYHIPALPTYGAGAPPGAPGATSGDGGGNQPGGGGPGGSLSPEQSSLYDAWFKANPHATPEQLVSFGHSLNLNIPPDNAKKIIAAKNAGGGLSHEVQPVGDQLYDNMRNDVAGVVKGVATLPDMAATAAGKVMSVVPTALGYGADALGFDNVGRDLHGAAHDLANPQTISGVVENVAPTPNTTSGKVSRFAGEMLGGAIGMPGSAIENALSRFVGEAPKVSAAQRAYAGSKPSEIADALQTEGIPAARPIADPTKRASMAYLETTRGGHGPVRQSLEATRASIADKVSGLAGDGEALTPGGTGEMIQTAGKRSVADMKTRASRLYDQAATVGADAPVVPKEALASLDSHIAELERNPNTNKGTLAYLKATRKDLAGQKTVADIRNIRTGISGEINRRNLGQTNAERIMGDVMTAARSDISRDLGSQKPDALKLYQKADDLWNQMSTERKQVLERLVGPADNPISGEQTMSRVRAMMGSKGDASRFQRVINTMSPEEQANFRSSLFNGVGQRSPEEPFSPAYFLAQTRDLQHGALKTVFGEDGAKSIQNLRVASQGFRDASASLNNSRSGLVMNFKDIVSSLLSLKKASGAAAGYAIGGPIGAAVGAVGAEALERGVNRLSAKTLMNPNVSQWVRKVATVKTDAQARALMGKLKGLGAGNAALQSELSPVRAALAGLNDNVPRTGSVAAQQNGGQTATPSGNFSE
jgi:hypothetical protein